MKLKKENLPHLIGLHKLSEYYSEIRQMEDKNDHTVNPKNIFKILREHNINYNNLKSSLGWTIHLQNRMENFTYKKLDSILRKATMFGFIYEEGKTKNTKAKYVLIDKIEELFLQFYIGYNEETKEYFPNSYVPNKEKDPNLSRVSRARKKLKNFLKDECILFNENGKCKCKLKNKIEKINLVDEYRKIKIIHNKITVLKQFEQRLPQKNYWEEFFVSQKRTTTN